MRYDVLENIKPEEGQELDNLGQLFNAYMGRLSLLEATAFPRENMRELRRLWLDQAPKPKLNKQEKKQAQMLLSTMPKFYHLQILSNSLADIHRHVGWAIKCLSDFFTTCEGDLKRYAIENRLRCIEENGSEDDSDWHREDEADDSPEAWKVVYKDDEQALKDYTLHDELKQHFAAADWRGEHIGSSGVDDFAYHTLLVSQAASFSPFKAIAKFTGVEIPIYRQNEAGEMVPQSAADRIENEVNDELRDVRVACYFNQILTRLEAANTCYSVAKESADYNTLLGQLESIRDCVGLLEPALPFND